MAYLSHIELTARTLAVLFALPFLIFFFEGKYRFWPRAFMRARFGLIALSIITIGLIAVLVIPVIPALIRDNPDYAFLLLLHFVPPILTLAILRVRQPIVTAPQQPAQQSSSSDYQPLPINNSVERLGWGDVIISGQLREELQSIIALVREPQTAARYGIEVPKGILMSGPPGTGKTTIAKVMANTAGMSFFALKIDEVVSKWVGDSEKNLSRLFESAVQHAPSIIFIGEIDALGANRGGHEGQKWADTLLNHLLQLIDGVVRTEGLYIIGATNRPELVDPALKRAGRLNRVIEVPLPDFESRCRLFALYLSRLTLGERVEIGALAQMTSGKSGADIKEICNQAGLNAFRRESGNRMREYTVSTEDLARALHAFGANHTGVPGAN